jgi:hypothetical protein
MLNETSIIGAATAEQIQHWKQQHGDVYALQVDNHICYLKKPDRRVLSMAVSLGSKDPMKFNEVLLENCWLGGSEAIKTNDELFIAAGGQLGDLIEVKQAELKKI